MVPTDFSTGKINSKHAQSQLGAGDRMLFILLNKAGLTTPRLSDEKTQKMANDAERIIFGVH